MRIRAEKQIVLDKLTRELIAAGVPVAKKVIRLPANGLFILIENETPELVAIAENIIEAHDGINDVEERLQNIPGWATWTEAEALQWFTDHIDNLAIPADVKALLRAYGRMLLYLRDRVKE